MKEMRFTLKREEIAIILETTDGTEKNFVLREMVGKDRDAYMTKMGSKMKYSPAGKVIGMKSFDGLQASLLERCFFDEEDKLVSQIEIQAFPTKTQTELFKIANKMNGLDQTDAEEDSKND